MKRKSQSLPKFVKLQTISLKQKGKNLVQMFTPAYKFNQPQKVYNYSKNQEDLIQFNPQKQKLQQILMKSKNMIQLNKEKVNIAKKFRIVKKTIQQGPFLTGLDIYHQEQHINHNILPESEQQKTHENPQTSLREILNSKYDDLQQLRKMISKTSQNLNVYKKQTMSIRKDVLFIANRIPEGLVGIDRMAKLKLNVNIN